MQQKQLCGLRLQTSVTQSYLNQSSSEGMRSENTGPLFKNLKPPHCSIELLDDVTSLLAQRLSDLSFPSQVDVPLADKAVRLLVQDYLSPGEVFDADAFRRMDVIMPELLLLVLEIMHPTTKPRLQLCKNGGTAVETCPDIYLRLWRHSYLQIPLITHNGSEGVFGQANVLDTDILRGMPLWLEVFRHLFVSNCSSLAVDWDSKYKGCAASFAYGRSQWTPWDLAYITDKLYSGWVWVLAAIYWSLQTLEASSTDEELIVSKAIFRHLVAAIRIVSSEEYVNLALFDCSNTAIVGSRYWSIPPNVTQIDVSSPRKFINSLSYYNIITVAATSIDDATATMVTTTTAGAPIRDESSIESVRASLECWRYLIRLTNEGIAQYLRQEEFL